MKRKIIFILVILLTFSGGYALATSVNGDFEGNPIIKIFSGGKELVATDVPAIMFHDRTMVPISLLQQLGVETVWDQDSYSVNVKMPKPETVTKIVHELTQSQLDELAKSVALTYAVDDTLYSTGQGSGFLLDNGVFITNEHVGSKSKAIQYYLHGKTLNNHGTTLFRNAAHDLYGVQTSETGGLKYSTALPDIGDEVWAIGYPSEKLTITQGTVTSIDVINGVTRINDTAHTSAGESGGALLNGEGEVIGITSSGVIGTDINYAIPMKYVQDELNGLK